MHTKYRPDRSKRRTRETGGTDFERCCAATGFDMEMLAFLSFRRSSRGVLANGDANPDRRGRWDGCRCRCWMTRVRLRLFDFSHSGIFEQTLQVLDDATGSHPIGRSLPNAVEVMFHFHAVFSGRTDVVADDGSGLIAIRCQQWHTVFCGIGFD